mgnify:FL=1
MLNVVALMGRMVKNPELRTTQSGISVTSFTLAVDRSYVKQGEERQCDFIDVVCWRGQADFVCKYFSKGQLIAVQGAIQTRTYTDRDGNRRKAVEIVADRVHFAEPKRDTGNKNTYGTAPYKPDIEADASDFSEITSDDLPF